MATTTHDAEPATTLARSHLRWVKVPGRGRTCVRIYDGPPGARTVMLLHGWAFTADTNWWPSYAALARHYRVVALDHCGHGLGLQGRGRFEFERCADDVAAVAAALGITDAVVAGYSMGGPIALMTARRHPELVAGLVLCATSLDFSSSLRDRLLGHAASASALVTRASGAHLVTRVLAGSLPDCFVTWWAARPGVENMLRHDWAQVVEAARAIGRFDARPWVSEIAVPTAVVVTTDDNVVPASQQRRIAAVIPHATQHDVRGGHLVCTVAPCQFVPPFLEACHAVTAGQDPRTGLTAA